jgi:hypothetical protein
MQPDFQHPFALEDAHAYASDPQPGPQWITPNGLQLAFDRAEVPQFQLTLSRTSGPQSHAEGVLALQVELRHDLEAASHVLSVKPTWLRPIQAWQGSLRLTLPKTLNTDLDLVMPLDSGGSSRLHAKLALDVTTASIVAASVEDRTVLLQAVAAISYLGLAARVPVQVDFEPQTLVRVLRTVRDEHGRTSLGALQRWMGEPWEGKPWRWTLESQGMAPPWPIMREALLDRLLLRFGHLEAPLNDDESACFSFAEAPSGNMNWRLDDRLEVFKSLLLRWHPLEVLRPAIERFGVGRFVRRISPPPAPLGERSIGLSINLPEHLLNVLEAGSHLRFEPQPPRRTQVIHKSLRLEPPASSAQGTVRLAFGEDIRYTAQPYLLWTSRLNGAEQVTEGRGLERSCEGGQLDLSVSDFPVEFRRLSAEAALLAVAKIEGHAVWGIAPQTHRVAVHLDRNQPEVCLALPTGKKLNWQLRAVSPDGLQDLGIDVFESETSLSLWHVPGVGAHTVRFTCDTFEDQIAGIGVEIQTQTGSPNETIHLRRGRNEVDWGCVVDDPFNGKFRYRVLPDGAWSAYASPLETKEVAFTARAQVPTGGIT